MGDPTTDNDANFLVQSLAGRPDCCACHHSSSGVDTGGRRDDDGGDDGGGICRIHCS